MRVPLSITRAYRPDWALWEGVRELVQNAKDAETEFEAPFSITHNGSKLLIMNEGCELSHRALLLGETTKAERDDLIGRWGDGLKIGVLALIRSGHPVTIKSGDEIWHPSIEPAPEYDGAEVLTFNIRKSRMFRRNVEVEIENIDRATWLVLAKRFRFLPGEEYANVVSTYSGSLLLDEPGMLYVKGIFVEKVSNMEYGYDFNNVELDIDRQTVQSWSRDSACRILFERAMREKPELVNDLYRMILAGSKDIQGYRYHAFDCEDAREPLRQKWIQEHGTGTIPVADEDATLELEHLGVKGVVVGSLAADFFGSIVGTAEAKCKELQFATKEVLDPDAIPEGGILLEAMCILENAGHPIDLKHLEVVDFKDARQRGLYDNGTIKISRARVAEGASSTIATLAHELAHGMTGSHDANLQKILEDVIRSLLASPPSGNGAN